MEKNIRNIRMIAIFLCLVMIAVLFTTVAFAAAETVNVANEAEFNDALSSGKNIVLTKSITTSASITLDKPVEIDLNGNTIDTALWGTVFAVTADVTIKGPGTIKNGDGTSSSPVKSAVAIQVSNNATLTIDGAAVQAGKTVTEGSTAGVNKAIYVAGGHVVLSSATVTGGDSEGLAGAAEAIYLQYANDTLKATNSVITGGNASHADRNVSGGAAIRMQSSGSTELIDCTVTGGTADTSSFQATGGAAVWIQNNGTLKVSGGTVKGGTVLNNGMGGNAVWMQNSGNLTVENAVVTGGEAAAKGEGGDAINMSYGAITASITNSTVTGGNGVEDYAGSGISASPNITSGTLDIQDSRISAGKGPGWSADPYGLDMGTNRVSRIAVTVSNSTISGGENGMAIGIYDQSVTAKMLGLDNVLTDGMVKVGKTGGGSGAATKEELTAVLAGSSTDVYANQDGLVQFGQAPNEDTPDIRPVYNETQKQYYGLLKEAVDAANPGDVLHLGEGVLEADTVVVIDKSLTIQGEGKDKTVIQGTKAGAVIKAVYSEGVKINISGVTIDGSNGAGALTWSTDPAYAQVSQPENAPALTIRDCIFTNTLKPNTGAGIGMWDLNNKMTAAASNVNIEGCTFTGLSAGIYFSEESPLLNLRAVIDGNQFTQLGWGGIVGIPANAEIKNNGFDATVGMAIQYLLNRENKQSATVITDNVIDSAKGIEIMPYHWAEGYNKDPQVIEEISAEALPSIKENVRNTGTDLVTIVAYRAGTDEAAVFADNALDLSKNYTAGKQATVQVTLQEPAEGKKAPAAEEVTPVVYDTEYYTDAAKTDLKSEVTGIVLDKESMTVEEGKTEQLTATVLPENADNKTVVWKSSDEAVVTVDDTGKITAKAEGKAVVTASVGDTLTADCEITVTAAQYGDKSDTGDRSLVLTAVCMALAALAAGGIAVIRRRRES